MRRSHRCCRRRARMRCAWRRRMRGLSRRRESWRRRRVRLCSRSKALPRGSGFPSRGSWRGGVTGRLFVFRRIPSMTVGVPWERRACRHRTPTEPRQSWRGSRRRGAVDWCELWLRAVCCAAFGWYLDRQSGRQRGRCFAARRGRGDADSRRRGLCDAQRNRDSRFGNTAGGSDGVFVDFRELSRSARGRSQLCAAHRSGARDSVPASGGVAMKLLFALLLPIAVEAQLAIYAVSGGTETVVGSSYNFGQVPLSTASSVQFRIYNTGSAPVAVTVVLSGAGFTFTSPLLPYTIPPNSMATQTLNITVSFTPTSTASFSASLQISSLSVILLGSGVTAPTLTSVSGCSASVPFNFGSVPVNNPATCTFGLQNLNPQARSEEHTSEIQS